MFTGGHRAPQLCKAAEIAQSTVPACSPSPSQPCYPLTLLSAQMPGSGRDKPSLENSCQHLRGRTPPSLISLLSPLLPHSQPSFHLNICPAQAARLARREAIFPLRIPVCKTAEEPHKQVSCSSRLSPPPPSPTQPWFFSYSLAS